MTIDVVQAAKALANATEYEGLLQVGQVQEVMKPGERAKAFRQILLSAEAQARIELWREYAPVDGVTFSAAWRASNAWFIGDNSGALHYSTDAHTWRVIHRFGDGITDLFFETAEWGHLWIVTSGGEVWHALVDGEPERWDWVLAYAGAYHFVGVGVAGNVVVAVPRYSKEIVTGADFGMGEWSASEVFGSSLASYGVGGEPGAFELWIASYTAQPYYSTDGVTWSQTTGAAGNAVAAIDTHDGTIVAGGPGGLWRSTDNGANWTTVLSLASDFIGAIGGGPGGWVALSGTGGVYESSDDGVTWILRTRFCHNSVWAGADQNGQRPAAVAIFDENADQDQVMAIFEGGAMLSRDAGVNWRGGCNGDPWRISIEAYQPELLDVLYEVPANQRLVGASDVETFAMVSS